MSFFLRIFRSLISFSLKTFVIRFGVFASYTVANLPGEPCKRQCNYSVARCYSVSVYISATNRFKFIDLTNLPRFFPRWLLTTFTHLNTTIFMLYAVCVWVLSSFGILGTLLYRHWIRGASASVCYDRRFLFLLIFFFFIIIHSLILFYYILFVLLNVFFCLFRICFKLDIPIDYSVQCSMYKKHMIRFPFWIVPFNSTTYLVLFMFVSFFFCHFSSVQCRLNMVCTCSAVDRITSK